ncbi:MAG: GtrA family protein [Bdellovibrionales bacterium]|nr:GtrA family protein [Bdellovibrionales bacterium]
MKKLSKEFLLFTAAGAIAALVNFVSRIGFNQYVNFSLSIVLAYLCGMITAFVLMKVFVFTSSSNKISKSALYFILINVLAVLQTWIISVGLAYYVLPKLGVAHFILEISHGIGVAVPVISSFIGHKYWTFR